MTTITLKINEKTKAGKTPLAVIDYFKDQKGIELVEEKNPYNPEFVKIVLDAANEKGGREIDPEKLWESL